MNLSKNLNTYIETEINKICIEKKDNKHILVLAGGGMNGIYILGVIKFLEEMNLINHISIYAGTSIGAIINLLLIIGYKSIDIYKFTKLFDMSKSLDIDMNNFFTSYSVNSIDNIFIILTNLIKNKNINPEINLLDFYKLTNKKFIVTAACLTNRVVEYISYENYPELKLLIALQMTTAVPILFPPVKYNNKLYCDGGLIDNFPIDIFENELDKVIGININLEYFQTKEINSLITYILSMMSVLILNMIKTYEDKKYKNIVYNLNLKSMDMFNFNLTNKIKKEMFINGYNFIKNNYNK